MVGGTLLFKRYKRRNVTYKKNLEIETQKNDAKFITEFGEK